MRLLLITAMIAMSGFAARAEEAVTLKDAPGRDIVEGYCGSCAVNRRVEFKVPLQVEPQRLLRATSERYDDMMGTPIAQ